MNFDTSRNRVALPRFRSKMIGFLTFDQFFPINSFSNPATFSKTLDLQWKDVMTLERIQRCSMHRTASLSISPCSSCVDRTFVVRNWLQFRCRLARQRPLNKRSSKNNTICQSVSVGFSVELNLAISIESQMVVSIEHEQCNNYQSQERLHRILIR